MQMRLTVQEINEGEKSIMQSELVPCTPEHFQDKGLNISTKGRMSTKNMFCPAKNALGSHLKLKNGYLNEINRISISFDVI